MGRRLPADRNHGSPDLNGVVLQTEVKDDADVLRRLTIKLCLICESNQASTNGPSVFDQ